MDTTKILLTGANGLLGQQLILLLLQQPGISIIATGKGDNRTSFSNDERFSYYTLDITDGVNASAFYEQHRPDIIIHAAAMTNVDECEENKVHCWNTNVTATRFLIDAAKKFHPYIIFLSTDFVFDGLNGPYTEDDIVGPVNYYGSSKIAAEKAIMESELPAAIVRTCLVYSDTLPGQRDTIISKVKNSLKENKKIMIVADQWRTPTYVEDLARGIILLVQKKLNGIFNISGKEFLTPYDMAMQVVAHFNLDSSLIEKANSTTFSQPPIRPFKTGFIIDKAIIQLGYTPLSFAEALQKLKD
jgi:dTDP-4-dehydrorhamnose reductase